MEESYHFFLSLGIDHGIKNLPHSLQLTGLNPLTERKLLLKVCVV